MTIAVPAPGMLRIDVPDDVPDSVDHLEGDVSDRREVTTVIGVDGLVALDHVGDHRDAR